MSENVFCKKEVHKLPSISESKEQKQAQEELCIQQNEKYVYLTIPKDKKQHKSQTPDIVVDELDPRWKHNKTKFRKDSS